MTNISEAILKLTMELRNEPFPPDVLSIAKDCIVDYLCTAFAGAKALGEKVEDSLNIPFAEGDRASIIGMKRKSSPLNAALINGMTAHYFELDDGSRFGMIHLGAPILSALFAAAQTADTTAEFFLNGLVVGYEIAIRLASAVQPGLKKKGFHATGVCGCIGAALAVSTLLGFDNRKTKNALAAATASAAGLLEMIDDGSQLKPFNAGKAAQNALVAICIGNAGFSGPIDPIGGKRGLLGAMGQEYNQNWFSRDFDMKYVIRGIYRKPYASCRHCHPAVEAALKLRQENAFSPEQIEAILVETYGLAVYGHDHTEIKDAASAKMSIPYAVAAAFILCDGGMASVTDQAVRNDIILALARKVRVVEAPDYSKQVPAKRIAKLTLELDNNTLLSHKVVFPKGEPENPLSADELREKYLSLMEYSGMKKDDILNLYDCVQSIEYRFEELLSCL